MDVYRMSPYRECCFFWFSGVCKGFRGDDELWLFFWVLSLDFISDFETFCLVLHQWTCIGYIYIKSSTVSDSRESARALEANTRARDPPTFSTERWLSCWTPREASCWDHLYRAKRESQDAGSSHTAKGLGSGSRQETPDDLSPSLTAVTLLLHY